MTLLQKCIFWDGGDSTRDGIRRTVSAKRREMPSTCPKFQWSRCQACAARYGQCVAHAGGTTRKEHRSGTGQRANAADKRASTASWTANTAADWRAAEAVTDRRAATRSWAAAALGRREAWWPNAVLGPAEGIPISGHGKPARSFPSERAFPHTLPCS